MSFLSFSQVITFECNNEIIWVSFDEISDNPNASMDWNGDGLVDESDYVIYFQLNSLFLKEKTYLYKYTSGSGKLGAKPKSLEETLWRSYVFQSGNLDM